jgi:hypothetical protein
MMMATRRDGQRLRHLLTAPSRWPDAVAETISLLSPAVGSAPLS